MTKALVSNDTTSKADSGAEEQAPVITYEDLESFRGLSAELEALQALRQWAYYPVKSPNGRYNDGTQHGNTPSDPTAKAYKRIEEIDERIQARTEEIAEKLDRIIRWLDTVDDELIRAMINWHYLQGLDWGKVCKKVYGYHNYHTCRSAVMRFMGKKK